MGGLARPPASLVRRPTTRAKWAKREPLLQGGTRPPRNWRSKTEGKQETSTKLTDHRKAAERKRAQSQRAGRRLSVCCPSQSKHERWLRPARVAQTLGCVQTQYPTTPFLSPVFRSKGRFDYTMAAHRRRRRFVRPKFPVTSVTGNIGNFRATCPRRLAYTWYASFCQQCQQCLLLLPSFRHFCSPLVSPLYIQ
jgi:hypothetical protein